MRRPIGRLEPSVPRLRDGLSVSSARTDRDNDWGVTELLTLYGKKREVHRLIDLTGGVAGLSSFISAEFTSTNK